MKRRNYIIASCLIVFYMLSMGHTLFHNHMHSLLAHSEIEHVEHSNCGCAGKALDHSHDADNAKECNVQTQFVPTDQKPKIEVHSIDVINHDFIASTSAQIEPIECKDCGHRICSCLLPLDPEILYHSLRAPPSQC